jgi:hypothetical protein
MHSGMQSKASSQGDPIIVEDDLAVLASGSGLSFVLLEEFECMMSIEFNELFEVPE